MLVDVIRCLNAWNDLEWRHHSTGLLQAYLPNDPGARVHIWNRGLKLRDSGELHNHRFTLQSHILVGRITHERLILTPDENGSHDVWDIPGASQGSNDALRLHDRSSVKGTRVNIERVERCNFTAGDSYTVRKWDFHHARQEPEDTELTVTFVRLHDKETTAPASLLYPAGRKPEHAFTEDEDTKGLIKALTVSLVHDARLHLRKLADRLSVR